ncbi:MAG: putative 2-aminoethylphosphonate ABC transporter substrate-binding protein, partial [Anaerovorax sp.]
MKKKINILFVVILVLVINLAFSGCVSKNTEGNEKKGDIGLNEQELNVYTALEDDLITDYLAGFKTKYPDVKVNITRDSTGIITAKLMAEKENP